MRNDITNHTKSRHIRYYACVHKSLKCRYSKVYSDKLIQQTCQSKSDYGYILTIPFRSKVRKYNKEKARSCEKCPAICGYGSNDVLST